MTGPTPAAPSPTDDETDAEIEAALRVEPTDLDARRADILRPFVVGDTEWSRLYEICFRSPGAFGDLRALRYTDAAKDADLAALRAENERLRRIAFMAYCGMQGYTDDGALLDARESPFIDFKLDAAEQIEAAIQQRGRAKLAALAPAKETT